MGCAVSGSTAEKEARARTNAIEKQLKLDRERAAREVKLLLLGDGSDDNIPLRQSNVDIEPYVNVDNDVYTTCNEMANGDIIDSLFMARKSVPEPPTTTQPKQRIRQCPQ